MILCTRSTSRSSEQSTKNTDETARTRERLVYVIVRITKLYDYQTWRTLFEKFARCAKVYGLFFLDCAFRMLIGWADELRSRRY